MLKKLLLIFALAAGVLAAPAQPQFQRSLLMPGVTFERQVQFTAYGPVAIHVITAPRPTGAYSLKPVLARGAVVGRDRVSTIQKNLSRDYTVAGVNGDLFSWEDGRPSSILVRSGVLDHSPNPDRSSLGITQDGTLLVDKLRMFGTWRGTNQRRPMDVNHPPGPNGATLYTPSWGPATPAGEGTVEAVVYPLPPTTIGGDIAGPVIQIAQNGNTPIPAGGAVLVARGTSAQRFLEEAPVGTSAVFRILISPDWQAAGVTDMIGGGPVLVREGKPVFRAGEQFTTAQLARNPRTGVGQLADGRVVFVVADGRRRGYSVGMTNFELAQTLVRLGAVTGFALDAGGSSTIAFDGAVLNRPSGGSERAVSECLCLLYRGVYAPPPAEQVLSPNGDGVAEAQHLAYKLPRPSTVSVSLVAPDGTVRTLDSGEKTPGVHRFSWAGATPEGAAEPDGRWRLTVSAVDDQGLATSASREFALNRTLGALAVRPSLVRVRQQRGGKLTASFRLERPALVTLRVETRAGAVVTVGARKRLPAGEQALSWNGRVGKRAAATGRYVLRVIARNELGSVDLATQFRVKRIARR
ncbi:MAG: phosphodiester glycosidase family protein [Gaiellaceae bacterium]